ncbi:hypothetical protein WJX72_004960 [[Myrmecia] bisecta]|uniref:Uncharacterized protein n=1 Tax=[Myrmecia] bisecta TaxID=41462 RepID=A0AAW1PG25_9CHLO
MQAALIQFTEPRKRKRAADTAKAEGHRPCIPSRTLLSRATGVPATLLSQTELQILEGLSWQVFNFDVASASVLPGLGEGCDPQ